MDKVLKIGIIGCGAIGKDHCRRIIETVPGATVVAVSDYVAAAADETAAKYGIKSYGNDCDGMIKDPEVEAVVITSIDPTHHDYVMKTLAEEKWCFCEKPPEPERQGLRGDHPPGAGDRQAAGAGGLHAPL